MPIGMDVLDAVGAAKSKLLYNILVQQVSGKSLAALKLVGRANRFVVLRRLVIEYEPRNALREAAMLSGVLRPTFSATGFPEQWIACGRQA